MKAMEYKGQKVITTAMLAEAYGTSASYISKNFTRNKSKFIEGKHYFYLEGQELKNFMTSSLKDDWSKRIGHIYLWTERGANHHCKILDTDKAWQQFENLEETYFRVKEGVYAFTSPDMVKYLNGVANYLRVQRTIMKDKGCSPLEIALMDKLTCDTYGIPTPECLATPRPYEQLALSDYDKTLIEANSSKAV
ncbi:MAG: ORF6N domain-containing protein [Ruminococcus sp.]